MSKPKLQMGTYVFGTVPSQAPEYSALRILVEDVIPSGLPLRRADAVLYALSCLAASRLLVRREIQGFCDLSDLLLRECWEAARKSGLPDDAVALVWPSEDGARTHEASRVRVLSLVADLASQFGLTEWNLADSIGELFGRSDVGDDAGGQGYDTGLCDSLIGLLDAPPGASLWIPFDSTGQLIARALRQGLQVIFAGPGQNMWSSLVACLLAIIEGRASQLRVEPPGVSDDSSLLGRVDYLLACPPIGQKVGSAGGWRQWEGSELGLPGSDSIYKRLAGESVVQLERSEAWAIAALWPHVRVRAVFLTAPSVLFAKGQEQRLREFLVLGARQPATVISLPPRLINRTGIVTAITVLDRRHRSNCVRMIDASSITIETKSTMRFARLLDSRKVIDLATGSCSKEGIARDATFDEITSQECNLMPTRYLKALTWAGEDRTPLGDLVETMIRAPVASKDATAITVQEVGISDLDRWAEVRGPYARTTTVQARKLAECSLQRGDILVSIKGTIGKVGLVGDLAGDADSPNQRAVCSQTCIALRTNREKTGVLPLYLYLRSDDFKNQLEAFRVGVSVAHVTPSTLLQDVKVPMSALLDQASAQDRYVQLCKLELEVKQAYRRMDEITRGL